MSDESHVMAGFQIKFLLLQKAMILAKFQTKGNMHSDFFLSVSGQNSSCKSHSAPWKITAPILNQNLSNLQANCLSCDAL